ncbi:hypothetical protein DL768_011134 [Monosporascus sp. mg162]|nr:hypothetical protein DL768_011134 [Monosporascus sp. mg162]
MPLDWRNDADALWAIYQGNHKFGPLVGIGGGVPVKTATGMIWLGDVVVSKLAGGHSGAVQYEHRKAKAGRFERTGALAPPPAVLPGAAQDLAARRAKDPLEDNIKRIDTSMRTLWRYRYPGAAEDCLYEPDYLHCQPIVPCDKCGCDPLKRIPRVIDDEDGEPHIAVHRGTIASSKLVVKDALLRTGRQRKLRVAFRYNIRSGNSCQAGCGTVYRGIYLYHTRY